MRLLRQMLACLAFAATLAVLSVPVSAQQTDEGLLIALLNNRRIVDEHPDLLYRDLGVRAYQAGDKQRAVELLLKAASYADKPAQAMLATMYWEGDGIPKDHPRGYAWMDLAADRGYQDLLIQREHYWAKLSPSERQRAVSEGRQIYAKYKDEVGLRKLDQVLQRAADQATGSRTGFGGNNLTVRLRGGATGPSIAPLQGTGPTVLGGTPVRGIDYYSPMLWSAAPYAKLKDRVWEYARREMGTVEVGPLQRLPAPSVSSGN
ncbi:MAG: hypothetical protein ABI178_13900 [Rhodanobacter sp.]